MSASVPSPAKRESRARFAVPAALAVALGSFMVVSRLPPLGTPHVHADDDHADDDHADDVHGDAGAVPFRGGTLTVDAVTQLGDPMSAMHDTSNDGFSKAGMSMSMQSPDPIPAGIRRLRVDFRVRADSRQVSLGPNDFTIVSGSGASVGVRHSVLGDGRVAPGGQLAGAMVFDVPDTWASPLLSAAGLNAPVPLATGGPTANGPHGH